jgi:hypothetical protein
MLALLRTACGCERTMRVSGFPNRVHVPLQRKTAYYAPVPPQDYPRTADTCRVFRNTHMAVHISATVTACLFEEELPDALQCHACFSPQ